MVSFNTPALKTARLLSSRKTDLEKAAQLLCGGGIVALPTETVYGLAANGLCTKAISQVFLAKNRPSINPLILHVNLVEKAQTLFDFSSCDRARFLILAHHFWPGPLTIIAKKAPFIPGLATANLPTVAVRIPDNQATQTIMANLDFPLVMPSANLSTRPSPTCADHVLCTLDGRIDAVVDDGPCAIGIESTVIKIDGEHPLILRLGRITKTELENVLKEQVFLSHHQPIKQPLSPGQSLLHYSPHMASVKLVDLSSAKQHWQSEDIFLSTKADFLTLKKRHHARSLSTINFLLSNEPHTYAAELYGVLYQCERYGEKSLIIVLPSSMEIKWHAVIDRLMRSAGHNHPSSIEMIESVCLQHRQQHVFSDLAQP